MTTIHFAAQWKGNRGTTSHCSRWSMRPPVFAATTTEKEKVTCSRCAKQLGITPAAKEVPKNLGTCPCCFRNQKTLKGARMVHHGYNRPGHGYIVGDCFGVKYPRFEDSCEGTVAYRDCLQGIRTRKQEYLGQLERQEVESLTHSYTANRDPEGNRYKNQWGQAETREFHVTVSRGAAEVGPRYSASQHAHIPSFEDLREQAMSNCRRDIAALTAHVAELETAIANWKPVP
jgi:hypothetical protein